MNIKKNLIIFIATGCYVGKIPFAPGTFGTIFGLIFCYLLSLIHLKSGVIISICIFLPLVAWISSKGEKILKTKDPGEIVIDEIAGIIITLALLPFNTKIVLSGFLLFRLFDILKPFPIKKVEIMFSGGWGILLDDVIAGIYARLILIYFII